MRIPSSLDTPIERQLLAARLARFRSLIDAGMYRIDLDALASRIVDDDAQARAFDTTPMAR